MIGVKYTSKLCGGKSYDLRNFLSRIFKEVKEQ